MFFAVLPRDDPECLHLQQGNVDEHSANLRLHLHQIGQQLHERPYFKISSSQLKTRRSLNPYPFGSQWRSTPSETVNGTRVFVAVRRS